MNIFSRISRLSHNLFTKPQDSGFVAIKSKPEPPATGCWFRSRTISGKDAGRAFYCEACSLGVPHDAPARIRHCGKVDECPKNIDMLPVRQIKQVGALPSRVISTWETDRDCDAVYEQSDPTGLWGGR